MMLFKNFQGNTGRLPQALTSAIFQMCKEQGFKCQADGDSREVWLDIYCDEVRTCIFVLDADNGPISIDGHKALFGGRAPIPAQVMEALTNLDAQLSIQDQPALAMANR